MASFPMHSELKGSAALVNRALLYSIFEKTINEPLGTYFIIGERE